MIRYECHAEVDIGDVYVPCLVCDACSKLIRHGTGNVYWLVRPDGEVHPDIWHTHKWPCSELDRVIEQSHGPGLVMFEELDVWLRQLEYNSRTAATRLQR